MTTTVGRIELTGLTAGPAQTWCAIRLVPLLRSTPIVDLRLHARLYHPDDLSIVVTKPNEAYLSYIPHAFVAIWSTDGAPVATYGTQLRGPADAEAPEGIGLRFHRRMARREDKRRLPLHLAMDGYLSLQFGGPPIAWQEWTRRAVAHGLSLREESSYSGADVPGLDEILAVDKKGVLASWNQGNAPAQDACWGQVSLLQLTRGKQPVEEVAETDFIDDPPDDTEDEPDQRETDQHDGPGWLRGAGSKPDRREDDRVDEDHLTVARPHEIAFMCLRSGPHAAIEFLTDLGEKLPVSARIGLTSEHGEQGPQSHSQVSSRPSSLLGPSRVARTQRPTGE